MTDHASRLDGFRCPACRTGTLAARSGVPACGACGARPAERDGVALLVRDPEKHEADLEAARRANPGWYVEQQPAVEASPWRHHLAKRRRYVESVLARALAARPDARASRLLDLGCGDGTNLPWLAPFAERLYGSDYNLLRLLRARGRAPEATLFLADLLDQPVPDGFFDAIFFNHVIEHVPDDAGALREVHRILAPGGLLVLGTPNEGAWWWQLAYRRAPEVRATTDHVHFYTADTIGRRLREAGFELLEVEHLGWGPPDWGWDARLRGRKWVDDWFERIGRLVIPRQASSLYLVATKSARGARAAA
ncbi:MAG TPA: class I SAM-dependent methyltransferase [Myxococcota bacterium]|jgi:SAM-dependent methyltransferase|nr:class I SAM-dependent methyltransferase [Myxococcota bacterium]